MEAKSGESFSIRDAAPSDAEFIARNILAGVGCDVFSENADENRIEIGQKMMTVADAVRLFRGMCAAPDTLYSYTRTRIACVGGRPAGSLTAYPSDEYPELRELTWGRLGASGTDSDQECRPGEFYLDTLAAIPGYRGTDWEYAGSTGRIGHLLMIDGIRKGFGLGLKSASLIVDRDRSRLRDYYSALGFRPGGEVNFFGHPYVRMVLETDGRL